MLNFTGLFLLVCVGSGYGFVDTSGTDRYSTKNFFSKKGKESVNNLQNVFNELENAIEDFIKGLKGDNRVLEALRNYETTFTSAKNTECSSESPEIYERQIKSFVDECEGALPIDELAMFYSKIEVAKGKVKEVDEELKQNAQICNKSPAICNEREENLLKELDNILSEKEMAALVEASRGVYSSITRELEVGLVSKTNDLCNILEEKIENIRSCLGKIS